MRSGKLLLFVAFVIAIGLFAFGQSQPNIDNGFKNYGSTHGSNIDSVALEAGNWMLHAPVFDDIAQRGDLTAHYFMYASSKNWQIKCIPNPSTGQTCFWTPGGTGVFLQRSNGMTVHRTVDIYGSGTGSVTYEGYGYTLNTADGATHQLYGIPGTEDINGDPTVYESLDTTGYHLALSNQDANTIWATATVMDRKGNVYVGNFGPYQHCTKPQGNTIPAPGGHAPVIDDAPFGDRYCSQTAAMAQVTDSNGNLMSYFTPQNQVAGLDTLGRGQPLASGTVTTNYSGCVSRLAINYALIYYYTGPYGNQQQIKTCYSAYPFQTAFNASVYGVSVIEAQNYSTNYNSYYGGYVSEQVATVILADGSKWTFDYDNYLEVTSVGLPTGGSVNLTWTTINLNNCSPPDPTYMSRAVASRTVVDNNGHSSTWNYTWGTPANHLLTNTVTDPLGNDVVHTFTALSSEGTQAGCAFYETQTQDYQGTGTGRQLLKQVDTTYSSMSFSVMTSAISAVGNVVPTSVQTTVFPSGKVSLVTKTYDSGLGINAPIFDNVLTEKVYDWGAGAPGALLKETDTTYKWQLDSNYLTAGLLDLPASVVVKDGNGNRVAETDYVYDETAYLSSANVSTQHGAPPGPVRGNLTTVNKWLNTNNTLITSHTNWYDTGEVYQQIDPLGHTTTHSYDPYYVGAYSTKTCNALNQCVSGTYDFYTGLLTSFTDQNASSQASGNTPGDSNHTSNYGYDNMFRLTSAQFPPDGSGNRPQTTFTYSTPNAFPLYLTRQKSITTTVNDVATLYFDGLGRSYQSQHATPSGTVKVDTTYDGLDHPVRVTNPYFATTDSTYGVVQTQYDALGRVTQTTEQDNSVVTVSYVDNCTISTDEAGKSRKSCTDGLGRLTNVWEDPSGLNYETDYQYDTLGNLLRVDQKGTAPTDSTQWRTRLFSYDSLSRLLTANNPESGTINYTYDANSNLVTKTDARSITTNYSPGDSPIDPLNRVTKIEYSDGHASEIYSYDQTSSWGSTLTNPVGRLTTMYHGNTGAVFSYDSMGRVQDQWSCGPHNCGSGSYHVNAQYDLSGNLISLLYPSTRTVNFSYNSADELNQVQFTQWNWAPVGGGAYTYWSASDSSFYPNGVPKIFMLGSGLTESTVLNTRLQLQEEIVSKSGMGTFADHVYNYGTQGANNGNIFSVTDQLNSGRTQSFSYDHLNRLQTASESRWGLSFVYDAWGNRLQQNLTSGSAGQIQFQVDGKNHIMGAGTNCTSSTVYCYDSDGNLLNDSFHRYDFNAENQILDVDNYNDQYTYDAHGNRVRKDVSGQPSTEYIYFNGQVVSEKNTWTEDWSDYIYANGKRIAKSTSFEDRILIQGTNCSGCGSQYTGFTINGISWLPYVIRSGDKLMLRQKANSGQGGVVLYFSDGSSTRNVATDTDGQLLNSDGMTGFFHYRTADLSSYAGKTLTSIAVLSETTSGAGAWLLKFADFVLNSTDGTVQPIYTNETTVSLTQFGTSGVTGVSGGVDHVSNSGDPTNTTWFYHGDQIGSSRLMSANEGWPVWQGTFLPYGEEYNPQITTNHFKFTGKERDDESGLDYFGARYYGNTLGRWLTPDWSANATAVPYANFGNPQSLNLYTYGKNNPTTFGDPDGHCPMCPWIWLEDKIKQGAKSLAIGMDKGVRELATRFGGSAYGESIGTRDIAGHDTGLTQPNNTLEQIGMEGTQVGITLMLVGPAAAELAEGEALGTQAVITDEAIVVRGGVGEIPSGTFSGSVGSTEEAAGMGIKNNQMQVSTAGDIRAAGGTVEYAPEPAYPGGPTNIRHVNVTGGQSTFSAPKPNPAPKNLRPPSPPKPAPQPKPPKPNDQK